MRLRVHLPAPLKCVVRSRHTPGVDIPAVKLSGPVRSVLRVLAASRGRRLAVSQISTDARVSPSAVRVALAELGKARLVQHSMAPGADRQPPRLVYWPTGDGYATAASLRSN